MDNNQIENNQVTEEPVTTTPIEPTPETTPVEPEVNTPAPEVTPVTPEAAPITPEAPVAPEQPVTPVVEPAAPAAPVAPQAPVAPTPEPGKKNNIAFIVIVAVLSLLIIVIGIVVIVKVMGGSSKGEVNNTTTTAQIEYTTKEMTTNTNPPSTTTRTYTTRENYTQTTRTTKSPDTPQPVKESKNIYSVDGYSIELSGDFELYTANDGSTSVYDVVDNMLLSFKFISDTNIEQQISAINSVVERYATEYGFEILDVNAGTIAGLNVAYINFTDGELYYQEVFMDNQYGDLVDCLTMSTNKFTAESITKVVYSLVISAKKTGAASAASSVPASDDRITKFDERLLKK